MKALRKVEPADIYPDSKIGARPDRIHGRNSKSSASLFANAERALREAVTGAIEAHRRSGHPIVVWSHGKVVTMSPPPLVVREPRAKYGRK